MSDFNFGNEAYNTLHVIGGSPVLLIQAVTSRINLSSITAALTLVLVVIFYFWGDPSQFTQYLMLVVTLGSVAGLVKNYSAYV